MKNKYLLSIVLLCASFALIAQTTVWTLESSVAAEGDWKDSINWRDSLVPNPGVKTVLNVPTAADCWVTDSAHAKQLVVGDNSDYGGKLIIKDGGVLTTHDEGAWTAVGYNANAEWIIETGGVVDSKHRFHVGLVSTADGADKTAILEVAGTLNAANKFTVNDPSLPEWTAECYVTAGGVINTPWMYIGDGGMVDVTGGMIVMQGVRDSLYNAYATEGKLTAEGGNEPPTIEVHMGWDTVTVITSSTSAGYVGLNEKIVSEASLGVYPNPATDIIYFKGTVRADVKVYSITGQLVLTRDNVSELVVETLSPGLYFVKADADGQRFVDKILIK